MSDERQFASRAEQRRYEFMQAEREKTMSEHTAGPWEAAKHWNHVSIEAGAGQRVATVPNNTHGVANARLIAAAPELLEALRIGLDWSEGDDEPDHSEMVGPTERAFRQAARAAIAKAKGEEDV